jgi:hypothetical protein
MFDPHTGPSQPSPPSRAFLTKAVELGTGGVEVRASRHLRHNPIPPVLSDSSHAVVSAFQKVILIAAHTASQRAGRPRAKLFSRNLEKTLNNWTTKEKHFGSTLS